MCISGLSRMGRNCFWICHHSCCSFWCCFAIGTKGKKAFWNVSFLSWWGSARCCRMCYSGTGFCGGIDVQLAQSCSLPHSQSLQWIVPCVQRRAICFPVCSLFCCILIWMERWVSMHVTRSSSFVFPSACFPAEEPSEKEMLGFLQVYLYWQVRGIIGHSWGHLSLGISLAPEMGRFPVAGPEQLVSIAEIYAVT